MKRIFQGMSLMVLFSIIGCASFNNVSIDSFNNSSTQNNEDVSSVVEETSFSDEIESIENLRIINNEEIIDSIEESSSEVQPIEILSDDDPFKYLENASYLEAANTLVDNLTRDNVDQIHKAAIDLGLIKPMYIYRELPYELNFYIMYSYAIESGCGNKAYQKALDNIYFRKALLAVFDHENFVSTTHYAYLRSSSFDSDKYELSPSYKISSELEDVEIKEGIEEAKKWYALALNNGLSNEKIEVYVNDHIGENPRTEYLVEAFNEVFGDHISIIKKRYYVPDYYALEGPEVFSGSNSFVSEFNTVSRYDGYYLLSRALRISSNRRNDFTQYDFVFND